MAGKYVDGFVVPVPKDKFEVYKKVTETAGRVWKEHGALESVECVADDVKPGKVTSFPQAVNLKEDEFIVFFWIVYESREHHDRVNAAVMIDPPINVDSKIGMRMFGADSSCCSRCERAANRRR